MSPLWRCGLPATVLVSMLGSGCLGTGFGITAAATGGGTGGRGTNGGQTSGSTTGASSCLVVSPRSLDFGYIPIGTSSIGSVTLTNGCSALVLGIRVAVYGVDADLFTVENAPATLGPSDSAAVEISYGPVALETRSAATVMFAASDGAGAAVTVFGEPVGSTLRPAPDPINFGYAALGTTTIACTTLTNYSSATVEITGVASFDTEGGAFALSQIDASKPAVPAPIPVSIAGGASTEVCFSFTPPISQDYTGQATLSTDGPSVIAPTVQLTGWGGGPQITCFPGITCFGQTLDHSITTFPMLCTNSGTAIPGEDVTIELEIVGPGASAWTATFNGTNPDAGLSGIAPGDTFQIDLTYTEFDGGSADATLIIELIGIGQATMIPLGPCQGQGGDIPPCQFVISPTSLNFANAQAGDTSAPLSFEIENVGTDSCTVQGLAIESDTTGAFHILSTSIAPDTSTQRITIPAPATGVTSSLTVTLDFAPILQGESFSAEAAFSISDPSMPNQVVPLSGSSESTCLVVAPNTLNFGDAGVDDAGQFLATPAQSFSVSNECQNSAQLESITLQSGAGDLVSQYSSTTGPTLPVLITPGSSVGYSLSCAPTTPGAHPAQLVISDGVVDTLLSLICSAP